MKRTHPAGGRLIDGAPSMAQDGPSLRSEAMGELWRTVSLVLTVAGLVIPIAAVLVALHRVRRQVGDLESKYSRVKQLLGDKYGTEPEYAELEREADRILASTASALDVQYLHENVQIHLRHAEWSQLRWPALWAGFGLVCSTAGSVIGLYLPSA